MHHFVRYALMPAGPLPLWGWIVIAIVVVLLLAALSSRRKKRQAVIKTRIG